MWKMFPSLSRFTTKHDTSTPPRSGTNGVAERAVRSVKEGTAFALLKSGVLEVWWDSAMECCGCLHNHRKMADSKTAFETRFGKKIVGPSIPFGTLVQYIPMVAKKTSGRSTSSGENAEEMLADER